MISAMIQGELSADPVRRNTREGKEYVTATARVAAGVEAIFVGLAVFDSVACERLLALHKGSSLAAVGTLEATEWQTKEGEIRRGWRLTTNEILSVYQARKRRDPAEASA